MWSYCPLILHNVTSRQSKHWKRPKHCQRMSPPRLDGLKTQLEGLSINQELLAQADTIEDLRTRLGDHRKALQDQPHLEAERQQMLADAEFILKEVPPGFKSTSIETLQPMLARRQSITELGNQYTLLVAQEKQMDANRRETEIRLKATRKEYQALAEIGSSEALHRSITAARKLGDMDALIQSSQSDCVGLKTQCTTELSRLPLWQGDLQALPGLEVPDAGKYPLFRRTLSHTGKNAGNGLLRNSKKPSIHYNRHRYNWMKCSVSEQYRQKQTC